MMKRRRKGFTTIEIVLALLVLVLLVAGIILWQRVTKINNWAVHHQEWAEGPLYKWIHDNSFQTGPGGGNPDGTKPPPPPGGLN
jgi:Tfp pilus assembly protein PilV